MKCYINDLSYFIIQNSSEMSKQLSWEDQENYIYIYLVILNVFIDDFTLRFPAKIMPFSPYTSPPQCDQ